MKNLFILLTIFGICSCQQLSEIEKLVGAKLDGELTPGYGYINHSKLTGDKVAPGDIAYFDYYIMKNDSILFTNVGKGKPEKMPLPLDESTTAKQMKPMHTAFKQMTKGDSLTMFIHVDSFPSKVQGMGDIKYVKQTFVLRDIKDQASYQADIAKERQEREAMAAAGKAREGEVATMMTARAADYTSGKLNKEIKTTATGLKYIIHEEGSGPKPVTGNNVMVQYYGTLTNGTMFDNSFKRGQAFNFPLGQGRVIKGWDEGIALLNEGAKATFFIPHHLAYGERGSPPTIPPKSELLFYVELEKANAQ